MLDSAIVVVGTKKIIPALVFVKIGRYSAYIEHYYMHTPNTMILIVEPISKPWNRGMFQHGGKNYWKSSCLNWPALL